MEWTHIMQLCVIAFSQQTVCLGLPEREQLQPDVCYRGNLDLHLFDTYTVYDCFNACRARAWCTGFTMHVVMQHCRLHAGGDAVKIDCPGSDFLFSEKSSWQQTIEGCECSAAQTCNLTTRACETTECPPAEPLEHGLLIGNMRYIGAKVEYLCNYGYSKMGTGTRTCQGSGMWSLEDNTPPLCAIVCAAVAPLGTNTVDPTVDSRFPGAEISYTCKPDHSAQAGTAMTLTCSGDGEWGSPPTCSPDCPSSVPTGTETVDPTATSVNEGSTIVYTCKDGHSIQDDTLLTLTCDGGSWGTAPTCIEVCEAVAPAGTNTVDPNVDSRFPGTEITYTCKAGFSTPSTTEMTLICSDNGLWGTPPICYQDCPSSVPTGTETVDPTATSVTEGSTIVYSCKDGHSIQDNTLLTLTCDGGSWGTAPTCIEVCEAVAPAGTNTVDPNVDSRFPGTEITYTCNAGFSAPSTTEMSLTCSDSGVWGSPPACNQDCPSSVPTGTETVDPTAASVTDGSTIVYTCKDGHSIQDDTLLTLTCDDGSWGTAPTCIEVCAAVAPAGTNTVDPTVVSRFPGAEISYTCTSDHIAAAGTVMTLTCSDDGAWGSPPACQGSPCSGIWTYFENTCYTLVSELASMPGADDNCGSLHTGAHLVDIKTEEEMDFLIQLYTNAFPDGTTRVWTGAFTANPQGPESYLWTDDTPMVNGYHNFLFTYIRSCVFFDPTRNFVWENGPCPQRYWSVCEYDTSE